MRHLYEYLEFDELSDEARENAINNVRERRYEDGSDICQWAVDDQELFEPPHDVMSKLFGEDYYEANGNNFMFSNDSPKDISFVGKSDPNYYIECAKAIGVTNDSMFYRWLGIPPRLGRFLYYRIKDSSYRNSGTNLDFDVENEEDLEELYGKEGIKELDSYIEKAQQKFADHLDYVLTKISNCIDSEYEDEGIIDHIENNDIKFTEDGEIEE